MSEKRPLTRENELFCLEYARTGNGTQSYKKTHTKCKSTDATISANVTRLLKDDRVKARLHELAKEMDGEKIAQAKEIQERLTAILRQQATEETVVVEGVDKGISEARLISKKPALKEVINAGTTLARMQGALDGGGNINIVVPVFSGENDLE